MSIRHAPTPENTADPWASPAVDSDTVYCRLSATAPLAMNTELVGNIVSQHSLDPGSGDSRAQANGLEDDRQNKSLRRSILCCGLFIDKKPVSFLFRVMAVVNLVSLTASAPVWICRDTRRESPNTLESVYNCYAHFAVIASVDAVLAVVFTVHLLLRVFYELWWKLEESSATSQTAQSSNSVSYFTTSKYTRIGRIVVLALVSLSLWWSVGIGIYRSAEVAKQTEDPLHVIDAAFYIPFVLRSLSVLSALRFIFDFSVSGSGLIYAIKWKQLFWVIVFYLFFVYLYALVAVQWIGGLNERCVYEIDNESIFALPVTHCVIQGNEKNFISNASLLVKSCYKNPELTCESFPNGSLPLNIDFRNTLQLGQFRTIFDAFFAVYEASSLELWTVMQNTAYEGANRTVFVIGIYYASMVFFLVIFVQQSIFLVVIIESFADLRGNMSLKKVPRLFQQKKDNDFSVLEEDQHQLRLQVKHKRETTEFKSKLALYYYRVIERIFIVIVLIDAVLTATKFSGINTTHAEFLKYWQWSVSSLFVLEVLGVLVFHLYHNQFKSFFSKYFIYLSVVAVGGIATAVLYEPTMPASRFHLALFPLFQAMRFPRALRLMPPLKRFLFKILGDGTQLFLVILMTLIFLLWISVITMQFFGYIESSPECDEIPGKFNGVFEALRSTFQVVMGEGWNDLMSQTMCHSKFWIPIMIYFILLHLFASLILLNFFVAVILDNLEYPEEKKREKLEQEQQQYNKKKVWHHLRVFKLFKPKTLATPKLTSSVDNPNLAESDVRRFFESGEEQTSSDFASYVPFTVSSHSKRNSTASFAHKKTSASSSLSDEITNLSLLSDDSAHLLRDDKEGADTDVYGGIQSMLENVKEIRKYNRDCENTSRGTLKRNVSRISPDGHTNTDDSEYDEYREKYHLFDSALFCMPPKHPVRKACTSILNYRIDPPKHSLQPVLATGPKQLCNIALNRAVYIGRFVLSPLPCFTWLMVVVTFATIVLMVAEYPVRSGSASYYWIGDLIFIVFTLTELIIKILSRGVFFNPNAAIRSLWDVLDWIIVLATITAMAIYMSACGAQRVINITLVNLNGGVLVVVFLRALRPLRLISLVNSMRRVVWDVLLGWRKLLSGGILSLMFIFLFASFGVQLFASQNPEDSVLGFCNDRSITDFDRCIGEFEINIYTSREFLPTTERLESAPHFLVPRVWYTQRRDFRFDTTPQAFLTLLELLSLEGWLDVRDMLTDPTDETTWLLSIYVHTYVFLGVNIVLQLFVGIVVNNFNEHKPDHSALLSVSQKKWTDLMQSISLRRPIKLPQEPDNKFRKCIYLLVVGKHYQHFVTLLIVLHSFTFCLPWAGQANVTTVLVSLSMVFSSYYIIELLLKLAAFGMVGYCHSWRNVFDFMLVAYSIVYIICAGIYLAVDQPLTIEVLTDMGLVLAVLKFFTILGKTSTLQDLTVTIVQTFLKGIPLLGVLLAIMITYTFLGCVLFSGLRTGEDINYRWLEPHDLTCFYNCFSFINFETTLRSFELTLRILTGEDWHHLLRDAMVSEPYCSESLGNCGKTAAAVLWFSSYYVIVTFIFINVIIAVLLENFTVFYSKGDTSVDDKVFADFLQNWYYFDRKAIGYIPQSKIKLFLRMLHLKELHTHRFTAPGHKDRISFNILTDSLLLREMMEELKISNVASADTSPPDPAISEQTTEQEDGHSFQRVLKMLAYRAEDIQTRLEPQELYERIELEESAQYEVGEKCILKWMQKMVKPVAGKLRHRLRTQQSHTVKLKKRNPHFESTNLVMVDIAPTLADRDDWATYPSDSEDEDDAEAATPIPLLSVSYEDTCDETSENILPLENDSADVKQNLLQQSYEKLRANAKYQSLASPHSVNAEEGYTDKWHEWIKMQKDWMNHLDNDDYFDDEL